MVAARPKGDRTRILYAVISMVHGVRLEILRFSPIVDHRGEVFERRLHVERASQRL